MDLEIVNRALAAANAKQAAEIKELRRAFTGLLRRMDVGDTSSDLFWDYYQQAVEALQADYD